MNKNFKKEELFLTLYTYLASAFLGWQIISFVNIYLEMSQRKIGLAFNQWLNVQTVYFPIAVFVLIVLVVLLKTSKGIKSQLFPLNYETYKKHILYFFILIGGISIN